MKHAIIAAAVLAVSLSACSGGEEAPEAEEVTETRMDDVDVIDGTISDDMVDLDTQKDSDVIEGEGDAEAEADSDAGTNDTDNADTEESSE